VVWVAVAGLYGIVTSHHLVRQVVSLLVLQTSTYVLLVGVGYKAGGAAPYYSDIPHHVKTVDPVVQALALTDVVVEAAVTALLLAFVIQAYKRFRTADPQELSELEG
jgi:multicomponent Na+:H+ antiporter subunit C